MPWSPLEAMVGVSDHEGPAMLSELLSARTRTRLPTSTADELRQTADELGQIDLGDPRWVQWRAVLTGVVRDAIAMSEDPQVAAWEAIADDAEAPPVVQLRVFARAVSTLRSSSVIGVETTARSRGPFTLTPATSMPT